jgi:protocatechuate 3,4-dioxygenase beta subunit
MSAADDKTIGCILSRREVLALAAVAGAAVVPRRAASAGRPPRIATWFPSCVVRPRQTEGPYFVDERLVRSDIRSEPATGALREGALLALELRVSRLGADSCAPLAGAHVDLWQCDALGEYSGVRDQQGLFDTRGAKFLRGAQLTDSAGSAVFRTIYPGWYPGRCVHLHFKIRTEPNNRRGYDFTSQLYFDDAVTDRVHARTPYSTKGAGRRRNEQDGIYRNGGSQLMLDVHADGDGWAARFDIGLQY